MARARKPSNLDAQLEQWAAAIVDDPASFKGRWKQSFFPDAREVRLDLGCGKGAFLARSAKANPEVLYIGMDIDSTCVARCAKKAILEELPNMVVARADAADLLDFFEPGELSLIHLNFNAPYPPKKMAARRLTHIDHLRRYRTILGENGRIELRTDNMPYWKWSLEELRIAGYRIDWQCEDLHGAMRKLAKKEANADDAGSKGGTQAGTPQTNGKTAPRPTKSPEAKPQIAGASLTVHHRNFVRSEYDEKLVEKGAVVYSLIAHPGPAPAAMEQTTKLGLVDYLPEDLDTLEHIPYGMEDTVFNMRNRKKNAREAQARRAWWERKYKSKRSTPAKEGKSGAKGVSCNKHENEDAPHANASASPANNK